MTPVEVYKTARKKHDQIFNVFVARPIAAVVVAALLPSRVTPNQLTFLNLFLFAAAACVLALVPGQSGAIVGVVVLELSYVFDCADGMLARTKKLASTTGHLLDFLTDEMKACLLVGGVSLHLWQTGGRGFDATAWAAGDTRFLVAGIVALVVVSSGLSLTTFVRRPEYSGRATTPEAHYETPVAAPSPRTALARIRDLLLTFLRFLNHYPSHVWIFALAGRLDVFFWMYAALNTLYLGQTGLGVFVRLGRFQRAAAADEERPAA